MKIFDIAFLGFAGFLFLCALLKMRRGGIRAFVRLALVALCALCAFFFAQSITDAVMATDLTSYNLTLNGEAVTGTVKEYLIRVVMESDSEGTLRDLQTASPTAVELITSMVAMVVTEILFVIMFIVLKILTLIVYAIIKIFIPKRDENGKRLKRSKLAGFAFSLAQAAVVIFVFLVPVMGVYNLMTEVVNVMDNAAEAGNNGDNAETLRKTSDGDIRKLSASASDDYITYADSSSSSDMSTEEIKNVLAEISGGYVFPVLQGIKVKDAAVTTFNRMYRMKMPDGKTAYLMEETVNLLPIATKAMELSDGVNAKTLQAVLDGVKKSPLMTNIMAEIISAGSSKWANGEKFMGIDPFESDDMDPYMQDLLRAVFRSFSNVDSDGVITDLTVLVNVFGTLDRYEVLDAFGNTEEGEDSMQKIMEMLGKEIADEKYNGAKTTFIEAVFDDLSGSPRLKTVIPSIINMGLRSASSGLGIEESNTALYDRMMADIINELTELSFNKNNVENDRSALAADPDYVTGDDYNAYKQAVAKVVDIMKNAGLPQANTSEGEAIASAIVLHYVNTETPTADSLAAYIGSLGRTSDASAMMADRLAFDSEYITFEEIKVSGDSLQDSDYKKLGRALSSLLGVFTDLSTDGSEADIMSSLDYAKLGEALDLLVAVPATSNLSFGLLDFVTDKAGFNSIDKVREAVATLQADIKAGRTSFTEFFKAVDATVQLANQLTSVDKLDDMDVDKWTETLKALAEAGKNENTMDILKNSINGIIPESESKQSGVLTNLLTTVTDTLREREQAAAEKGETISEETLKKDGEAMKDLVTGIGKSNSLSEVINTVCDAANSESEVVQKTVYTMAKDFSEKTSDNEDYLSIGLKKEDLTRTESGEENDGSKFMGAVVDTLGNLQEETFAEDTKTMQNIFNEFEKADVDVSGENPADNVNAALAENAELKAAIEKELTDNTSASLDALREALGLPTIGSSEEAAN